MGQNPNAVLKVTFCVVGNRACSAATGPLEGQARGEDKLEGKTLVDWEGGNKDGRWAEQHHQSTGLGHDCVPSDERNPIELKLR